MRGVLASVAAALLVANESYSRVVALPHRLRLAMHMPPHQRITLDEPALLHAFGTSAFARSVGLALLHGGPFCLLALCFGLGETWGKLGPPWRLSKLRLLGSMWDFSFGRDEPLPPKLMRAVAREQCCRLLAALLAAVAIEGALMRPEWLVASWTSLVSFGGRLRGSKLPNQLSPSISAARGHARLLSAAAAVAVDAPRIVVSRLASAIGVGVHAIALVAPYVLRGRPPGARRDLPLGDTPVTRWFGRAIFVTWHSHVICLVYYGLAVASTSPPREGGYSAPIAALVQHAFPVAFALASSLTLLFYIVQYIPQRQERRRAAAEAADDAYAPDTCAVWWRRCRDELCDHVEHAPSLPVALLYARTLRVCSATHGARTLELLAVAGFVVCYALLVACNWLATRRWPYPVLDAAQKAAGPPGVVAVVAAAGGLCMLCGYLGTLMALQPRPGSTAPNDDDVGSAGGCPWNETLSI